MSDTQEKISDKEQLDNLTKSFFYTFNNKDRRQVDLDTLKDMCIPEIIIIKKTDLSQVVYSLTSFIEPRIKLLSDGTLRDFEETETLETTHIAGHIAQRQSIYQKSGYLNDAYFIETGIKLFQFVKTGMGWKISSLVWEDDEKKD